MTASGERASPNVLATEGGFHIPSLDGLRAVAVLIVYFSHALSGSLFPGGFGVTIFFFLSGYLITTLMRLEMARRGRVSLRHFYLRRVLRIFPPMYLTLAASTLISYALRSPLSARMIAAQALHFGNYYIFAFHHGGQPLGTDVLWSLAVEEHFYLGFPLLYIAMVRRFSRPAQQATVLLTLCGLILLWRIVLLGCLGGALDRVQHGTDTRLDSLLFGCTLAVWRNPALPGVQFSARHILIALPVALLVLLATIASRNVFFRETSRYTLQGIALFVVFTAAVRFYRSWPFKLLELPPIRWIGLLSYSFYLVHCVILAVLVRVHVDHERVFIGFVASLLVSAGIYYGVEKPAARLRRRLSRI